MILVPLVKADMSVRINMLAYIALFNIHLSRTIRRSDRMVHSSIFKDNSGIAKSTRERLRHNWFAIIACFHDINTECILILVCMRDNSNMVEVCLRISDQAKENKKQLHVVSNIIPITCSRDTRYCRSLSLALYFVYKKLALYFTRYHILYMINKMERLNVYAKNTHMTD